jgi:hypothetical protein
LGQTPSEEGFGDWVIKFDSVTGNRDKEREDPKGYGAIEYLYPSWRATPGSKWCSDASSKITDAATSCRSASIATHPMTVQGKRDGITLKDLRDCAKAASMGIGRTDAIYHEVLEAVMKWERRGAPQSRRLPCPLSDGAIEPQSGVLTGPLMPYTAKVHPFSARCWIL